MPKLKDGEGLSLLRRFLREKKRPIAYLFFGVCTTALNLLFYALFTKLAHLPNLLSTVLAWLLAVIFAFVTNKLQVFESRALDRRTLLREAISFLTSRLATGLLDVGVMFVAVDLLGRSALLWKLVSNAVVIVLNYVASKLVIFRTPSQSKENSSSMSTPKLLLAELPLLLILLPRNITGILLCVLVYPFLIALLARGARKVLPSGEKPAFRPRRLVLTVPTAVLLGGFFYLRYRDVMDGKVGRLLHRLVPALSDELAEALLLAGAIVLAALAVFSLQALLAILAPGGGKRGAGPAADDALFPAPRRLAGVDILFCALLTIVIALTMLNATPFARLSIGQDPGVFVYIGRKMQAGAVPYRDFFDHKGIVLYFLQWLGLTISFPGTLSGIWLLEIANLFAFLLLFYKTMSLVTRCRPAMVLATVLVAPFCLRRVLAGGNYTEEWALPWIALALYVFLFFLLTKRYKKSSIFLLGVGFAAVFFLRVNMVGVWAVFLPVILVLLVRQKRAREIASCAGLFAAGLAAVAAPILIYTLATGSLSAFIDDYFLFNLVYTGSEGTSLWNIAKAAAIVLSQMEPLIVLIFFSLALYARGGRRAAIVGAANSAAFLACLLFASVSGRPYEHYALPLFPFLALPLAAFFHESGALLRAGAGERFTALAGRKWARAALPLAVVLTMAVYTVAKFPPKTNIGRSELSDYLQTETSPEEDVLLISIPPRLYLENDRYTDNKYFYQGPPVNVSDKVYREFIKELDVHPSDVILVGGEREEFLSKEDNLSKVVALLDERAASGTLTRETHDEFFVYRRVKYPRPFPRSDPSPLPSREGFCLHPPRTRARARPTLRERARVHLCGNSH